MKKFFSAALVAMFVLVGILPAQATTIVLDPGSNRRGLAVGCQDGTWNCTLAAFNGTQGVRYDVNASTGAFTSSLLGPRVGGGSWNPFLATVQQGGGQIGWNFAGGGGVVYQSSSQTNVSGVGSTGVSGITASGIIVGSTAGNQVGYTTNVNSPYTVLPGFGSGLALTNGALDIGGQTLIWGSGQLNASSPTLAGYWIGTPGAFTFNSVFGSAAPGSLFGLLNTFSADGNVYAGGVDGMLCRGARNGLFAEQCADFGDPFMTLIGADMSGTVFGFGAGSTCWAWEVGSSSLTEFAAYNAARGRTVSQPGACWGYTQWLTPTGEYYDAFAIENSIEFLSYRSDFQPLTTVPEPGTIGLLAVGLAGLGAARRRRRKE